MLNGVIDLNEMKIELTVFSLVEGGGLYRFHSIDFVQTFDKTWRISKKCEELKVVDKVIQGS